MSRASVGRPPNTIGRVLLKLVICAPSAHPTGCWEYPEGRERNGYCRVRIDGKRSLVHRLVYEHFVGPIPEGLEMDHLCRNRACANFEHLEPVSSSENTLRGDHFGRRQTHCKHGHAFTEETTYRRYGRRYCRACFHDRYLARKGGSRVKELIAKARAAEEGSGG